MIDWTIAQKATQPGADLGFKTPENCAMYKGLFKKQSTELQSVTAAEPLSEPRHLRSPVLLLPLSPLPLGRI